MISRTLGIILPALAVLLLPNTRADAQDALKPPREAFTNREDDVVDSGVVHRGEHSEARACLDHAHARQTRRGDSRNASAEQWIQLSDAPVEISTIHLVKHHRAIPQPPRIARGAFRVDEDARMLVKAASGRRHQAADSVERRPGRITDGRQRGVITGHLCWKSGKRTVPSVADELRKRRLPRARCTSEEDVQVGPEIEPAHRLRVDLREASSLEPSGS